jgi:ADP-ribose pyrophosphatase
VKEKEHGREVPGYRLEERKEIFRGRIFRVELDHLEFDDGLDVTMEVVRHGGAAAVVPVKDDGRVVLIRQFRYPIGVTIWEVPAGKFDGNESSEVCAARETEEEVGYRPGRLEKIGSILTTPGFSDERIDIFVATDLVRSEMNLDPDELIDVVEVPIAEALRMVDHGEIEDAKSIVALLMAARRLGWERRA